MWSARCIALFGVPKSPWNEFLVKPVDEQIQRDRHRIAHPMNLKIKSLCVCVLHSCIHTCGFVISLSIARGQTIKHFSYFVYSQRTPVQIFTNTNNLLRHTIPHPQAPVKFNILDWGILCMYCSCRSLLSSSSSSPRFINIQLYLYVVRVCACALDHTAQTA